MTKENDIFCHFCKKTFQVREGRYFLGGKDKKNYCCLDCYGTYYILIRNKNNNNEKINEYEKKKNK